MSVERLYAVGFGLLLDDTHLSLILDEKNGVIENWDTLAEGGLFEAGSDFLDQWPCLRIEQCFDQWSGRIESRVVVTTNSSTHSLDLEENPQMFPLRLTHTGTPQEIQQLEEFRRRYCPQETAGFVVSGIIL